MNDKLEQAQGDTGKESESTYILPEKIKSLEDVITRIHSEADFVSKAFGLHSDKVIKVLETAITKINETRDSVDLPISKLKENNDRLEALINTLVVLPKKTEELLVGVQDKVVKAVSNTIPGLVDSLSGSHKDNYLEIKESINECISDLKNYIKDTETHTKNELSEYKREMADLIEVGTKRRMRRFLSVLLISGTFSAIVSGVTSWIINKHFPRSIEITGTQNLVVKDSQVLVHGSQDYKLEKPSKDKK